MPKDKYVFPYGIRLREHGATDVLPVAEVSLQSREDEWLSLFFVIDSGAAVSALPKNDAQVLGVNIEKGVPMAIAGIEAKTIMGWRHELSCRFGGQPLKLPVVFLDSDAAPRVLGRLGVFERFTIVFEESRRRSGFLGIKTSEAQRIMKILDSI